MIDVTATPTDGGVEASDSSTAMNALVGAVVTLVAAPFLPFAAVLGGGVAGYLQRSDRGGAALVGTAAGGIAAVPALLFVWVTVGAFLGGPGLHAATVSRVGILGLVVVVGYHLLAGAVGGALGGYVRTQR